MIMNTLTITIMLIVSGGFNVVCGNEVERNIQGIPWQPIPFGAFPPQPFPMTGGNEMIIPNTEGQFNFPQGMTEATVGDGSTGSMANVADGSNVADRPIIAITPPLRRPPSTINSNPKITDN